MKILLKQDVINLGYAGEVIDVANGYGRNYLLPQGLAVKATDGVLKEAGVWRQRAAVRVSEIRKENEALSAEISKANLVFNARAGETGKLYGSITTADIAEKMNQQLGTEIDRRIITSQPLRQLGEHRVTIKLGRDFHPQITVFIHPLETQDEEVEEVVEVEAGAEGESAAAAEVLDPAAEDAGAEDAAAEESEIEDVSIEEEITDTEPDQETLMDSELDDVTSTEEDLDQTA
jgi:large subunit ribosomal protein L9